MSASHVAISYVNDLSASVQAQLNTLRQGPATANFAVLANTANSASYAALAGQANSANFATTATTATRASNADSASFATAATSATTATTATNATNATNSSQLGGVAAAGYAQLSQPQSFTKGQAISQINSSGALLQPNCDSGTMFRHVLTGFTQITTPIAPRSGMVITIHLIQDSTGGRTGSWATNNYKFPGGTAPVLSTTPFAVDVFAFQYDISSDVWRSAGLNVS